MKKKFILFYFFLSWVLFSKSQTNYSNVRTLHTLKIGDTLPDVPLKKLLNFKTRTVRTEEFKGKSLIIDFWSVHCPPCISSMPRFQILQQEFGDRLQILISTTDKEQDVLKLLQNSPIAKNTKLAISAEDTLLSKLFPHTIIPHEIWIDEKGIVKEITSDIEVTKHNVERFLSKEKTNFGIKRDFTEWNLKHYFSGLPVNDSAILFRSLLTKHTPGSPASSFVDRNSENNIQRCFFGGTQIVRIYFKAFVKTKIPMINRNYIQFDFGDSSIFKRFINSQFETFIPDKFPYFKWNTRDEWLADNVVNYENISLNALPENVFFNNIIEDLNKYMPFKGKVIDKPDANCWIIRKAVDNAQELIKTKGNEPEYILTTYKVGVINKTMDEFVNRLNWFWNVEPIYNETGIDIPIDLVIDIEGSSTYIPERGLAINSPLDINILKKQLNKYGLDIIRSTRTMKVLVMTDK
jgi:thiol-disulfide isomerase/thioredoxin